MAAQISTSDSVIGSLCREVDGIRQRCSQLLAAMRVCQDTGLLHRLRRELQQLQDRRHALLDAARHWRQQRCVSDDLALEFLIEISSRSVVT
jgi:hypothetical protein